MKKINSREFQKAFSKLTNSLKPGEVVEVTRRGKSIGRFTKAPVRGFQMPNLMEKLDKLGYSPKIGESILKRFHDSLY